MRELRRRTSMRWGAQAFDRDSRKWYELDVVSSRIPPGEWEMHFTLRLSPWDRPRTITRLRLVDGYGQDRNIGLHPENVARVSPGETYAFHFWVIVPVEEGATRAT